MATIKSPHRQGVSPREHALALLKRKGGATVRELMSATGWQAHSLRASLSGLRKQGHVIARTRRGEETCYRIVSGE